MHGLIGSSRFPAEREPFVGSAGNNVLPEIRLTPQAVNDGALAMFVYYWSLPPQEREKIDRLREKMQEVGYV